MSTASSIRDKEFKNVNCALATWSASAAVPSQLAKEQMSAKYYSQLPCFVRRDFRRREQSRNREQRCSGQTLEMQLTRQMLIELENDPEHGVAVWVRVVPRFVYARASPKKSHRLGK